MLGEGEGLTLPSTLISRPTGSPTSLFSSSTFGGAPVRLLVFSCDAAIVEELHWQ